MIHPFGKFDEKTNRLKDDVTRAEEMLDECVGTNGEKDAQLALDDAEEALSRHLYSDPQEDSPNLPHPSDAHDDNDFPDACPNT